MRGRGARKEVLLIYISGREETSKAFLKLRKPKPVKVSCSGPEQNMTTARPPDSAFLV